jgi:hypothetical protein
LERYKLPIAHGSRYKQMLTNTALPSWEDASRASKRNCSRGDWASMAVGHWHSTHGGELRYEPDACQLRRLTAEAARECLANRSLTFVGDSVSRY